MSIFSSPSSRLRKAHKAAELEHTYVDGTDLSLYPDAIRRGRRSYR